MGAPDLQSIAGYLELRRRYLRTGLQVAMAANLVGLLDAEAPAAVQSIRLAVVLLCGACTWRLRRGGDVLRLGQVVTVTLTAGVLAAALLRLPAGWPVSLNFVPILVVFGTLVAGTGVAAFVAAASVVVVAAAYLLPGAARPPYLIAQVTSWAIAVVVVGLFVRRLAQVLGRGAAELAASAEALGTAQRASAALSQALSSRVAGAVDELARVLREAPGDREPAVAEVSRVLAESRLAVPPEPALPDVTLGEQLRALRLQAMDWTLVTCVLVFAALSIRNATLGPSENLPMAIFDLGLVLLLATLRGLRPRWRPTLNLALWAIMYVTMAPLLWDWFARAPIPPPSLPIWLAGTIIVGVTAGPVAAAFPLAELLAIGLPALHLHPGISWTAPVALAFAYGALAWVLWRWPRDLLRVLRDQQAAAAAKIRERRRLVATLFHDLANPLQVVLADEEGLPDAAADAEALERARAMVGRMQETLVAAVRGCVVLRDVEAGRLCDDLVLLFREPQRRKRISLRLAGPRSARLRCDEALLRDSVLANLFSNALKFSPDDGVIDLTVRLEPGVVALVLEDRGPGLPPEVLAALGRGGASPSRPGSSGERGTGYGLMLARDYLLAMGGSLELAPREGGGLSALVRLPAAEAARPRALQALAR
jgi:signal transduction histidine kinase